MFFDGVGVTPSRLRIISQTLQGEWARDEHVVNCFVRLIIKVASYGSYKAVASSSLCSLEAPLKGKPEKQLNL